MQNMILATPVLSDAAILTGSTGAGNLTIDNLKRMSPKMPYRVLDDVVTISVDLGSAQSINLVALLFHNCSDTASVRVQAGSTNDINAAVYDSGLLPMRSDQTGFVESGYALEKNNFIFPFDVEIYRYWFLTIEDVGASFIDIGRLYISNAFQPSVNMEYGLSESFTDPSKKNRTVSGEVISRELTKFKWAEFTLGFLSKDDVYGKIFGIENERGRTRDVLFIPDPDEKDFLQYRTYYGTMESIQPKVHFQHALFSKAFRIEELPA